MSTQPVDTAVRTQFAFSFHNRWCQLACGVVCAMVASNPQYIWTLLTHPLMHRLGVSLPALQVTFSILIVCQTFLSPLEGYLIERFGARWLLAAGGALTGLSWILTSSASSLTQVYLAYGVIGGLGVGIIVVGTIGLMARWFPDKRGLAIGVVMAGFGMGSMLTICIAFAMEAAAMTLWLVLRHDPLLFVLLSGVVFLGWGEIFSLFPSTLTDTFGSRHAIVNYACLSYTQGVGSILGGPVAALLHQRTGG
jgi:MFS family permease